MEIARIHYEDIREKAPAEHFELGRTPSGNGSSQHLLKIGYDWVVDLCPYGERSPGFRVGFRRSEKCQQNQKRHKADRGRMKAHQVELATLLSLNVG
jgi:hypothetical protein